MIINDAECTREIESRIVVAKSAFDRKLDLNLRKKLLKCCICIVLKHGHFKNISQIPGKF
jgi:hypothetical protein